MHEGGRLTAEERCYLNITQSPCAYAGSDKSGRTSDHSRAQREIPHFTATGQMSQRGILQRFMNK